MTAVPTRSYTDFATRKIVVEKVVERRLGFEGPASPEGWKWDIKYLVKDRKTETLPCPDLKSSHLLGVPRKYWQNGPPTGQSRDDLKVSEVLEVFAEGRKRWAPIVHSGDVNIWRDAWHVFSDDSVIESVDITSLDPDGNSTHVLGRDIRPGSSLSAAIFRRDQDNEYLPWRQFVRRENFTGTLDSEGSEQTTRDGDTIYWSNVDTTKREFITFYRDDEVHLLFNQFACEIDITTTATPTVIDDFNDLEYLGSSSEQDGERFFTKYFPLSDDSTLKVYVVDVGLGTWAEWSIVDTFTAANQVKVDKDLGVLIFGDATTSPPPRVNNAIYVSYRAVPRIEYEEDGFSEELTATDADVNPLGQSLNRGFVVISRSELDVGTITLSTTKPAYGSVSNLNAYGPVYVGSDYAPLYAEVLSSGGEVVPNIEVTFWTDTSPEFGSIGGVPNFCQRRTGYDGVARSFYTPPVSVDEMGYYVTHLTDSDKLTVNWDAYFEDPQDIYTYYVLKDDPWKGIAGADTSRGETEWSLAEEPNGRKAIYYKWDPNAVNPISGFLGAYAPVRPSSVSSGGNILTYSDPLQAPNSIPYGASVEYGTIYSSSTALTIVDSSKSWDNNEWSGYILTVPSTGDSRRIASNTSDTLTLTSELPSTPSGAYSIRDKTDNLGAYWVVSDRYLAVRASAYSPKYGRTIFSNSVILRVEIPPYMKGSYINSSLQDIPFGWRVRDDNYEVASAVNGVTYLCINPVAGPYPIVDIIGGQTWHYEDWWLGYGPYPVSGASRPFAYFTLCWNIA